MKKTTLILAAALCGLAGLSRPALAAKIGKDAPAFTLKGSDGKSYSLKDFKGSYVVLEWTNPECPFVVKHYGSGNMQALQKEEMDKGVKWLSINSSRAGGEGAMTPEEANETLKEQKASPTALLLDSDGKVGKAYGAQTTPHMFVVDPKGKLIYAGAIDDKPSTKKKDIAGAKNYVRQALDEAMAGKPVSEPSTKSYGCSVKY